MLQDLPLVSIVIITYNSSEYIFDTLESSYAQSYPKLELIVSDDCSSDDTAKIVKEWINSRGTRFERCMLIQSPQNTGSTGNCNRGIKECRGEWVRLIAGDDLLTLDSIFLLVREITPEKQIIIGSFQNFRVKNGIMEMIPTVQVYEKYPYFFEKDAYFQHRFILYNYDIGLTQGSLIKREVFLNICTFDERFPFIEDLPFWLNVTKKGIKLWYSCNLVTLYRIHNSLSHVHNDKLANQVFQKSKMKIIDNIISNEIPKWDIFFYETFLVNKFIYWLTFKVFKNKRSFINRILLKPLKLIRLLDYRNKFINQIYLRIWMKQNKNKSVL